MCNSPFSVSPYFITIDGPDGAGKSTLAKIVSTKLSSTAIKPTYFSTSPQALAIELELKKKGITDKASVEHNAFFLRALEENYRYVILPSVDSRRVIVADSSEIRALAYALDNSSNEAIADTKRKIASSRLTCGLHPCLRVVLIGSDEDLWSNLSTKSGLDYGDPQNVQQVADRKLAYTQTVEFIMGISGSKTHWLVVNVEHVQSDINIYFSGIADMITECYKMLTSKLLNP